MADSEERGPGFGEVMLGRPMIVGLNRWLARLTPDWRVMVGVAGLLALVLIPYLGAVGLWDPWESHYGEVARQMIHRRDYVYPFWEGEWFFSKPPLTMWMQALGMQLVGTDRTPAGTPVALYTEWGIRLPFTLLAIASVAVLCLAVKRIVSVRAALATAFALVTMPLFFLISRETVTDSPMVACITLAVSCAAIALFDPHTRHRTNWWMGFHVFTALTFLAKEMLAAIPPTTLLVYAGFCVFPWWGEAFGDHGRWLSDPNFRNDVKEGRRPMPVLWDYMFRMKLLTGLGVFLLIGVPWYLVLAFFPEVEDEGMSFVRRFVHDNFLRLGAGVHTTTPGGSFTYFIEQGGYAIFPWVAAVPGVFSLLFRSKLRSPNKQDQFVNFTFFWMLISFAVFGFSATKFHHYVFPVLPAFAVLVGIYVDRLWEDYAVAEKVPLIIGAMLFALVAKDLAQNPKNFTDLFVYNYERPYPQALVNSPLGFFGLRALWTGDLLTLLLLAFGAYLAGEAFRTKVRNVGSRATALGLALAGLALLVAMATRGHQSPTMFLGLAGLVLAIYVFYEGSREPAAKRQGAYSLAAVIGVIGLILAGMGSRYAPGADPLLVQLMQTVNIKMMLGIGFAVGGGLAMVAALMRQKTLLFGSFWSLALIFALWFNWSHWVDLSHQWTQRDIFWRYYAQRRPSEPIAAFQMNWKGETFYSRNTVKQVRDGARMAAFADLPGRKWAITEQARLSALKNACGANHTVTPIDPDLNVKFVLVTID